MGDFSSQPMLDGVIPRQHLLDKLVAAQTRRIRLLCAPAGFGKSVLARQFAEYCNSTIKTSINSSINQLDQDTQLSMSKVIWVALSGDSTLPLMQLQRRLCTALGLPKDSDAQTLQQALADCRHRLLILDDYQPSRDADAWLWSLIQTAPDMQCLITARRRPAWPLSRLLLDGQLLALESEDLALTLPEVISVLDLIAADQNLCARHLHQQTDGWVAGIRLFVYAQQGQASLMQLHLHRYPALLDYLDQEVLGAMSVSEQGLLNLIAHAPFVDSALCAFLSGATLSLQELLAKQACLRRLPGSADQYTVYEPLRSVLRERYPQPENSLRDALTWLEHAGRHLSAFAYAICLSDATRAVQALAQVTVQTLFRANHLALLLDGLNHLDVNDFVEQPQALSIATRALLMGGKLELAERYLMAFPQQAWQGTQLALQAELALHRGQAQAACGFGGRALIELNQDQDWTQMILCFSCITRAELALGQYEQAQRQQMQGLELARLKGEMLLECQLLLDQAQVEELAGHLQPALQLLDKVQVLIGRSGGSALLSAAQQIRRGWLLMLIGDDVAAPLPLAQGLALSMAAGTPAFFYSYVLLAQLDARRGAADQAQQGLAEVQRMLHQRGISESIYRSVLSVASVSVGLLEQHYQPAIHLLARMGRHYNDPTSLTPPSACPELFALMSFLHAQVLCTQGAIDEAIGILTQVLEKAEEFGFQVIVSQALMALGKARHQRGDIRQAERMLASAAAMAMRQGQGQLIEEGHFLTELQCVPELEFQPRGGNGITPAPLIGGAETLLSPREHVVLTLIAKGHSNAEIAEILSISLHTVKAHAKRINAKFQVNRRALAVARAKTLGLLL